MGEGEQKPSQINPDASDDISPAVKGEFIVRQFHFPEDYTAAIHLWENGGSGVHLSPSDSPEETEKKLAHDPDLFLVAEEGGKLVGTVIGGFDGRRGLVYHLVVDPEFRQRGLGTYLMDELESRLRKKGCIRCYLLVTPENEYAMRFYETRGWERMQILTYAKNL
jgi:ribosomal protein S18 acetylase RimI-like enzyme